MKNRNNIIINNYVGGSCNGSQKSDSYRESDFTGEVASDVMGYLFLCCIVAGILWGVVAVLTAIMKALAAAFTAFAAAFVAALPFIGCATVVAGIIYVMILRKRTRAHRYGAYRHRMETYEAIRKGLHQRQQAQVEAKEHARLPKQRHYAEYVYVEDNGN